MDPARKDCVFQTLQEERQFKGAAQKLKYFNLDDFLGLILDGNWEKVEMYLSHLTKIGDNELSRQIYTLIHLHKHCKDLKETSKKVLEEIQAAQTKLVNYILSWHHSRYPVAAPRPKFLSSCPDRKCISGQHVSQIAPNMQDSGSASAAPQRRTTRTARRSLGAVTNTIPSNAPVRTNYSNTGQSASKVQRARSEFPASVARTLDQSSSIASMDFNPVHSTKLLGAVTNTIPSNAPVRTNYSNTGQSASKVQRARSEFPASVARTLDQSSSIASMDFNPVHSTKLLGAVTNTIPSNAPVRTNYSNTGQSASKVQRARSEFPASVARTLDQSSSIASMDFNPVHSTKLLGAVTNTIPSNAPVRTNYSNTGQSASKVQRARSEFPASVARTLDQSSSIASMDFNPVHSTKLLVGTVAGDIALWEVDSGKMTLRPPQLWDTESLSPELLSAFEEASISVCCVRWNEDGTLFGVAYSKHIIQLFSCPGSDEIVRHKEINAHIGSVNDLVFASKLLITCGGDRRIKVWDLAAKFQLIWLIEGFEAPVYSLCPVVCGDIRFLISHSLDGEMKIRRYDQHTASSTCLFRSWKCTTKSYTADSKRLFTSGTDGHGKPYIVEWQVRNGERKVKRAFQGLHECSGQLHFDLNKNCILAAGYNHQIRFWDIDNGSLLGVSIADGNLPDVPLIKFNKDGNLLAVTTKNNSIKILASRDGMQLLQTRTQLPASEIAANTSSKRSFQQICNEISPQLFPAKRGRD